MKRGWQKNIILFVGLSLTAHFSAWLFSDLLASMQKVKKHEVIEMEIVSAPKPPMVEAPKPLDPMVKQDDKLVDTEEKPLNDEVDKNSKFLSEHNQKVLKQTIAAKRGDFKNQKSLVDNQEAPKPAKAAKVKDLLPPMDVSQAIKKLLEKENVTDDDVVIKQDEKKEAKEVAEKPQKATPASSEASQTLDYIKEIDPGLETLLSTKEFKYYSFFSRIRTQLNQHWTPKVKNKIDQIYRQGRRIASTQDMITRCLVTLDKSGHLLRIQIIGNSGLRELDEAATESWKAAAPFPNPPSGMVDSDGTIKLKWEFILEA